MPMTHPNWANTKNVLKLEEEACKKCDELASQTPDLFRKVQLPPNVQWEGKQVNTHRNVLPDPLKCGRGRVRSKQRAAVLLQAIKLNSV